jgi:hypothetical protein
VPKPKMAVKLRGQTLTNAGFCGPCQAEEIQAAVAAIRVRERTHVPALDGPVTLAATTIEMPPPPEPAVIDEADAEPVERAPDDGTIARWSGVLAVEGELTGDGRLIEIGALHWGQLPIPLRWDMEDDGEHKGAVVVGLIEVIERQPDGKIWGQGFIDLVGENGWNAARLMERKMLRGISIDPDDVDFEIRLARELYDQYMGTPIEIVPDVADPTDPLESVEPQIEIDPEGRVTVAKMNSDDEVMVMTDARIRAATLVDTPAFVDSMVNLDGPLVARPSTDVGVTAEPGPESDFYAAETVALAASAAPIRPPAAWFANPNLSKPTPFTVTADGRVFGHIALWGTCHTSFSKCVTPPFSKTNYAWFRTGVLLADDGTEVAVGRITLDTGHAGMRVGAAAAVSHYDNTGFAACDVAAGEDTHGIWVAGAVRPGITDEQLRVLRSSPLSGDWRRVGGGMELMAVLAVNMPGFPVPRALVASGRTEALTLPVWHDEADPLLEQITEAMMKPLPLDEVEVQEMRALVASAKSQRADEAARLARSVEARELARALGGR